MAEKEKKEVKDRSGRNQKLKMLYLMKIFSEETDDTHGLTMPELIARLAKYDVSGERKTLYGDLEALRDFGMDIIAEPCGKVTRYHLGSRDFELPELKLLVDSVQAARFITDKKSQELILKLERLCSRYSASQLHRQVTISGRIKSGNERIYYTVDRLHEAIENGKMVSFQYFQWNVKKEQVLRHDGAFYHVSPWAMMWDDEKYYLLAYDASDDRIKHYRVDKMMSLQIEDEMRNGQERFREFDLARYSNSLFGMFGGEEIRVTMEADASMAGVFIDRFGEDIQMIPKKNNTFRTTVTVAFSDQFLGWVFALGDKVKIISPEAVVTEVTRRVESLAARYQVFATQNL